MRVLETIENLRAVGQYLVKLNYPLGAPSIENDIAALKKAYVDVDGYSLVIHFSKADYGDYHLETFQIIGRHAPFLPFAVVVKLAQLALGCHNLSLVEFYQDDRKVYCWQVCLDKSGRPMPSPYDKKSQQCTYEGFEYRYIESKELSFY